MREKQIRRSSKSKKFEVFEHFFNASFGNGTFFGPFNFQSTISNTNAGIQLPVGTATNPGILRLLSGTVASSSSTGSRTSINTAPGSIVAGSGDLELEFVYKPTVVATQANDYEFFLGFGDSVSGSPANGAFIYFDWNTTPPNLQCVTRDSSTGASPAPSTVAISQATTQTLNWTKCNIKIPKSRASAIFTFNDTDVVTINTAVPLNTAIQFTFRKFNGTQNEGLDLDYVKFVYSL